MEPPSLNIVDEHKVEQSLTCSICRDLFNEPITLFCNHTFCHYCIKMTNNNKRCPLCNIKVWDFSLKTINYNLKDIVISLYGEERYQTVFDDRKMAIYKKEMEFQVTQEIKDSMWKSLLDTLHLDLPLDSITPEEPDDQPLMINTNHHIVNICRFYNTVGGCINDHCIYLHTFNTNLLVKHLKDLKKKYPFLVSQSMNACRLFNTIDGCPLGIACNQVHIPDPTVLKINLIEIKEKYMLFDRQLFNIVAYTGSLGIVLGSIMRLLSL